MVLQPNKLLDLDDDLHICVTIMSEAKHEDEENDHHDDYDDDDDDHDHDDDDDEQSLKSDSPLDYDEGALLVCGRGSQENLVGVFHGFYRMKPSGHTGVPYVSWN